MTMLGTHENEAVERLLCGMDRPALQCVACGHRRACPEELFGVLSLEVRSTAGVEHGTVRSLVIGVLPGGMFGLHVWRSFPLPAPSFCRHEAKDGVSSPSPRDTSFSTAKVAQALLGYFNEEVDSAFHWHCDHANCAHPDEGCFKVREFATCPEVLAVHLVRWAPDGSPLLHHMDVDGSVTVHGGGQDQKYMLMGVVCRSGRDVASGHYYAFAKHQETWYLYNDALTRLASPDELSSLQAPFAKGVAYLAFYQKERPCPSAGAASPAEASAAAPSEPSGVAGALGAVQDVPCP